EGGLSVGTTWMMNLARFRPSSRNPHKSVCDMQFNQIVSTARRRQIGHQAQLIVVCRQELSQHRRERQMVVIGLLVTLEARAGKEADAEAFLKSAQPLAWDENETL